MLLSSLCLLLAVAAENVPAGAVDAPFAQEYHEGYSLGDTPGANDVRSIAVAPNGDVWAATKAGAYRLKGREGWEGVKGAKGDMGPAFDVVVDPAGAVWIAAWNGVYRAAGDTLEKIEGIDAPVAALCIVPEGVVGAGPEGLWRIVGTKAMREDLPSARGVRAVMPDPEGGLWIATGMGLFHHGGAKPDFVYRTEEELLSCDVKGIAAGVDGALWIGGLGGVTLYKDGKRAGDFTTATAFSRAGARRSQDLPSIFVQCVACGPDGRMWVGTNMGVARYDGTAWSLRHSRRWLMDDDVRDVAFASDGTAWVATAKGVSAIRTRTMTLEEKAAYYLDVCYKRHIRPPFIVEKCWFPDPNDLGRWEPRDDDNDGSFTAMYMAMEAFRWAVTKDPVAKEHADKAYEALEFLEQVTGVDGLFARTVVPSTWTDMADANHVMTPEEYA